MLPRRERLTPSEIVRVRRVGTAQTRIFKSPFCAVYSIPNGGPRSRFAILIRKKVAPKATERNRLKRAIRESVRAWPRSDRDFVVIAHAPLAGLRSKEIKEELNKAITHLR